MNWRPIIPTHRSWRWSPTLASSSSAPHATPQAARVRTYLDELERLVGEMRVGKTQDQILQLVQEVQLLLPHVHSIMEVVRMQARTARG